MLPPRRASHAPTARTASPRAVGTLTVTAGRPSDNWLPRPAGEGIPLKPVNVHEGQEDKMRWGGWSISTWVEKPARWKRAEGSTQQPVAFLMISVEHEGLKAQNPVVRKYAESEVKKGARSLV